MSSGGDASPAARSAAGSPAPAQAVSNSAAGPKANESTSAKASAMFLGPALMASTASTSIRLRAVTSLRRPSQPYHVPRQLGKARLEPPLVVQGRSTALLRHHVVGVIHRVGGLGIVVGEHRVPLDAVPAVLAKVPLEKEICLLIAVHQEERERILLIIGHRRALEHRDSLKIPGIVHRRLHHRQERGAAAQGGGVHKGIVNG